MLAWCDSLLDRLGKRSHAVPALVLLMPALSLLAVFWFLPMCGGVILSLYGGKFAAGGMEGVQNYAEAMTNPDFWNSVRVTLYHAVGVIPPAMGLSFLVAYQLYRIKWLRGLLRSFYFLPFVTSTVAAAMVWRMLLHPQSGIANALLALLGLEPQQWFMEPRGVLHLISGGGIGPDVGPSLALSCIILFDIWHSSGFMIVVFLAGLSTIPPELEEVARLDGASFVHRMRAITLPLLSPTIFFLLIVSTIKAFQAFNSFYALTAGSRTLGATENLVMHVYRNFYDFGYWGYAAAVATLLTLAIVVMTLLQWRLLGRRVFYE